MYSVEAAATFCTCYHYYHDTTTLQILIEDVFWVIILSADPTALPRAAVRTLRTSQVTTLNKPYYAFANRQRNFWLLQDSVRPLSTPVLRLYYSSKLPWVKVVLIHWFLQRNAAMLEDTRTYPKLGKRIFKTIRFASFFLVHFLHVCHSTQ